MDPHNCIQHVVCEDEYRMWYIACDLHVYTKQSYLDWIVDWIAGPDWWTWLLDLVYSYHMTSHPIKCRNFGYSNCLIINCTSSSHCMLMYVSAHCTSYIDRCVAWVHGVHTVSSKHPLTIVIRYAKEHQNTDKGHFTTKITVPWRTPV